MKISDQNIVIAPSLNTVIRVAIADDHWLFRSGVKGAFSDRKDIKIVAEADDGAKLLDLLQRIEVDVVLLDIQMPVMDGLVTLPQIKLLYPKIKVIILSMHNDISVITRMMEIGASSYLTKESSSSIIYEAITQVHKEGFYINELTNAALIRKAEQRVIVKTTFKEEILLTEPERNVLKLMWEDKATKEISEVLELSPRTIWSIQDSLKSKIGTISVADVKMYALRIGLVELNDTKLIGIINGLSKEQLAQLFRLCFSILAYINHDLANQRTVIYHSLDVIENTINGQSSDENSSSLENQIGRATKAVKSITVINNFIKEYFSFLTLSDPQYQRLFITRPYELFSTIRKKESRINISIKQSSIGLQIIFPRVVLLSILSELVENSRKVSSTDTNITLLWYLKEKVFVCEVHDNGPGFRNLNKNKFVPLTSLSSNEERETSGMGLKIIEKTIIDAGGRLFFTNSEIMNGAKVYFEIPILASDDINT
jgi:DNA-binding NarL/FixJ family response regulator